jgi:fatty-acyl-CoA synthase
MTLAVDNGPTDVALLDETIGENLRRTIATYGDHEAVVARHQGIRWTYAEFGERVERLSAGLLGLGIEVGDRVGLWCPNYAEWTLLQYATANVGAVLVNVNPAYRTHELAHALNRSGCRVLFAAPSFQTSDCVEMVDRIDGQVPSLERAVFIWEDEWDEVVAGAGGAGSRDVAARAAALTPDDPINVQYTSGPTGLPEGVTLTHRDIVNNGYFVARLQRFTSTERPYSPVAFYHCVARFNRVDLDATVIPPLPTVCGALHWGQQSWIEIHLDRALPVLLDEARSHVHGAVSPT